MFDSIIYYYIGGSSVAVTDSNICIFDFSLDILILTLLLLFFISGKIRKFSYSFFSFSTFELSYLALASGVTTFVICS